MAAQFTQALASLALSMVAVRALDPAGFGQYSLVISTLLVMTGLTTGLVGDSLTVLDRHQPDLRYALQVTALGAALLCAVLVASLGIGLGWFTTQAAPVVLLAVLSFLLEDVLRRTLMASFRFAAVLLVDLSYAVVAAAVLIAAWSFDVLGLAMIFLAMAIGQFVAIIVAVALLPTQDRYLVRRSRGGMRTVLSFGGWRASLGVIGPARQWGARVIVAGAAGLAAVGTLEANRMLVAPVLLAVQGLGSAILVTYSKEYRVDPGRLMRSADRDALVLFFGAILAVLAILPAAPVLGQFLLGSTELVDPRAIIGWGLVAVGIAGSLPFATLTSVAGVPRTVVGIRVIDLILSLVGVWALMATTDPEQTYVWAPAVLGLVVCATALLQRNRSAHRIREVTQLSQSAATGTGAASRPSRAGDPRPAASGGPMEVEPPVPDPPSPVVDPHEEAPMAKPPAAAPVGAAVHTLDPGSASVAGATDSVWGRAWRRHWIAICAVALVLASETKFVLKEDLSAGAGSRVDIYILLEVAVFAFVGALVLLRVRGFPSLFGAHLLEVGLLAYTGLMAVSVVLAPNLAYAVIRVLEAMVVLLVVRVAPSADEGWFLSFVRVFLIATAGLVLVGLTVDSQRGPLQLERFNWLATHSVIVGQFLALAVVASLILAAGTRWHSGDVRTPAILVVSGGIFAAALLANNTRGSGAAAAAGAAVGVVLVLPRRLRSSMVLLALYLGTVAALTVGSTILGWLTRGEDAETLGSLNARLPLWRLAVGRVVEESPLFGFGIGASRSIFVDETGLGGAHNAVLNVLVDVGIIGVAVWAATIAYAAVIVVRHVPRTGEQITERALWLGTMTTLVVNGLTTDGIGGVANVGMVWMFLLVARATQWARADHADPRPGAGSRSRTKRQLPRSEALEP